MLHVIEVTDVVIVIGHRANSSAIGLICRLACIG